MFVYEENESLISTNSWRNVNCGQEEGFVHICKLYLQFSIPDHQGNIVRLHVQLTSVSFMKWNFASLPFSKHLEFRVNACRVLDKLVNTDHITANTQRKTFCKPNMSREVRNYDLRKLKIDLRLMREHFTSSAAKNSIIISEGVIRALDEINPGA